MIVADLDRYVSARERVKGAGLTRAETDRLLRLAAGLEDVGAIVVRLLTRLLDPTPFTEADLSVILGLEPVAEA